MKAAPNVLSLTVLGTLLRSVSSIGPFHGRQENENKYHPHRGWKDIVSPHDEMNLLQYRGKNEAIKQDVKTVTIAVSFQVIYDGRSGEGYIEQRLVAEQIAVLNTACADHGCQFKLRETVRTNNAAWYKNCGFDHTFKNELRDPKDGPEVLYFYTCRPIVPEFGPILGYATFPTSSTDSLSIDGVVSLDKALAGGTSGAHEVSHWLGLYDTIQDGQTAGAFVDDKREADYLCEIGTDSYPGSGPELGWSRCWLFQWHETSKEEAPVPI